MPVPPRIEYEKRPAFTKAEKAEILQKLINGDSHQWFKLGLKRKSLPRLKKKEREHIIEMLRTGGSHPVFQLTLSAKRVKKLSEPPAVAPEKEPPQQRYRIRSMEPDMLTEIPQKAEQIAMGGEDVNVLPKRTRARKQTEPQKAGFVESYKQRAIRKKNERK